METTIYIDDIEVAVDVDADFVAGEARTYEHPGEPEHYEINSVTRMDNGEEVIDYDADQLHDELVGNGEAADDAYWENKGDRMREERMGL